MSDTEEKTEKLGVGLTEDEKRRIRVEAAKRGKSMSELAREIILENLDGDGDSGNLNRTTTAVSSD